MSLLRTVLLLSRAAALPTVWSNCLAGWWLGGGRNAENLPFLFLGGTCLYLGGVFLHDAFDAEFDRERGQARPIPSGAVSWQSVWRWGLAWLALGTLLLLGPGTTAAGLGLGLVVCIILYNTVPKTAPLAPVLLGVCRFFLYVIGAATAARGVTGWAIWCGLALAVYVAGLGCFQRWERAPGAVNYWPVVALAAPVVLAMLMDTDRFREAGLLLSAILALWTLRALRPTFWSAERNVGLTVAGVQAGIVFVDWLACADGPRELSFLFIGLFGIALLFQRFMPRA